jgi:transketolase
MSAAHHGLSNLCAIIDYNKMQSDDWNKNIMGLEPLGDKWRAFNWTALEIDGHDFAQIAEAVHTSKASKGPAVIIAHTHKGRGVSYMEGNPLWHGSVKLKDEELARALSDLSVAPQTADAYLNRKEWPCEV